jgi:hypothetical protein
MTARLYLSSSNDEINKEVAGTSYCTAQLASQTVQLTRPRNPYTLDALRSIHWIYIHRIVWVIDVEFATVRREQPVPFCIAIRDAKIDALILRTAVNYDSAPLTTLHQLFRNNMGESTARFHYVSYMAK